MPSEQLRANQRELDVLLGLDSDAYISENLKKYEDVKEKWANSSMEEWKTGGQGDNRTGQPLELTGLTLCLVRNRE